jgi:hypothetical protein
MTHAGKSNMPGKLLCRKRMHMGYRELARRYYRLAFEQSGVV